MIKKRKTGIMTLTACFCALLLGGCATSTMEKEYYKSLSVTDPDLSQIVDGRYSGKHTLNPPFGVIVAQNHVKLEVVIADHSYEDIIIKTESIKDSEHLKKMKRLILDKQTLQIDGMSGATSLTGKAYLKAIEDALE